MRKQRDRNVERQERNSFILLQHVYTITEADTRKTVVTSKLAGDLGFGEVEASELIDHLSNLGYFELHPGRRLAMSPRAVEYIERLAWRRYSIRSE